MRAPYPLPDAARRDPEADAHFAYLQELVRGVRTLRSEFTIPQDRKVRVAVKTEPGSPTGALFERSRELISLLTGAASLAIGREEPDRAGSIPVVGRGFEAFVYIKEAIDIGREAARLRKESAAAEAQIERTRVKLANQAFVSKAPPEVVKREEEKLEELTRRIEKIAGYLQELEG